ncbi:3-oxoacyl-[acyl-carrier-protein] synthase III C-terminal domain-containing protein [Longirhabdus pacifica]|uniref:3-oxoacyl-[acyl-carrier-protein] synthase III C-terminal domain-containing protein n=1 Tax=Longirhabdus pacifica TaxID=2305227 RepID=UPI0013E8C52F|nr:3-oxoacyl-[acyl-carrier-protein] synthase III C-terminal domain-containing protein [Longirhabdus pacifica]
MVGLQQIACYVPEKKVNVSAFLPLSTSQTQSEMMEEKVISQYGLHHIAVEEELTVHEMIEKAAATVLQKHAGTEEPITWILHTHTFHPFTPYLVDPISSIQLDWGLENAKVRCIAQMNCASIDMLLQFANRLLLQEQQGAILLLCADKMIIPDSRYLKDSTVSGDAAAAMILSSQSEHHQLLASVIQCDASLYHSVQSDPADFAWFQQSFYMGLVKILRRGVKQAGIQLSQLTFIFPSNVNELTWRSIASACEMDDDVFYYPTMREVGHAHNADPLLNLQHALTHQALKKGDYYATLTVGMGSTFGCSVFQY